MEIDITYKGVEFQIEFDFQPEEPMVMYYKDGSGYPGCAAEVTINEVKFGEEDFYEVLEGNFDDIEEMIFEKLEEQADDSPY